VIKLEDEDYESYSDDELIDFIYNETLKAREIVGMHARRTPVDHTTTFSRLSGCDVFMKYENLQRTGSFKLRGALYKTYKVKGKAKGVVAASAGNHAQGVAYAASRMGLPSIIFMPETASISKVEATKSYGATVVLHGKVYDEAESRALEISREKGYAFIHPFDDPYVIAGQGTLGHEILEDLDNIKTIVVPVGGGGLISGISVVIKRLSPTTRIIGVEPENAPKFTVSLKKGEPTEVDVQPTVADGLATKKPGKLTFRIVRRLVDKIVTVSEEELAKAIFLLIERGKIVAEGAGAASIAALISGKIGGKCGRTLALISGGNIDLTTIYRVALKGLAEEGRIASIKGRVPDLPGTLSTISSVIAKHRSNIIEVLHDRTDLNAPAWHTTLKIVVETPSREELQRIVDELEKIGYHFDITS
jgi:threonine dehydratase